MNKNGHATSVRKH